MGHYVTTFRDMALLLASYECHNIDILNYFYSNSKGDSSNLKRNLSRKTLHHKTLHHKNSEFEA